MKTITISLTAIALLLLFSCNSDDTEEVQEDMIVPIQGTISLALSNGAGFVAQNISAFVEKKYDDTNTNIIDITGVVNDDGFLEIIIRDEDNSFRAFVENGTIPIGDSSLSYYALMSYTSDDFVLEATSGTFEIIRYDEDEFDQFVVLDATFSAAGESTSMVSSIDNLVLTCSLCN